MDSNFSSITNYFADGIFGHVMRFLFDRIFGNFFTNNINFNNVVDLKNCHFKDLNFDLVKLNRKYFHNTPFRLFHGCIGNFAIKFPSLTSLLTESIEMQID